MAKKITDFFTVSESDSGLLKRKLKDIDESNKVDDKKVRHKQVKYKR